jgi:GxxExxY protein
MTDELFLRLPAIVQGTYFHLNPLNPTNSEANYQELLRINLELEGYRVFSEVTVQKKTTDRREGTVKLKQKSERFDLTIDSLKVLFELKNLVEVDDNCVHQTIGYLDNSEYEYGVLINFAKVNKKRDTRCTFQIYQKGDVFHTSDLYGHTYTRNHYVKIMEFVSENYWDLIGRHLVRTEDHVVRTEIPMLTKTDSTQDRPLVDS